MNCKKIFKFISLKKIYFISFLIVYFLNILPIYSLENREELFREALDMSSTGEFTLAVEKWNRYLEMYPDDPAALSNRGNVRLILGDPKGSIEDQNFSIKINRHFDFFFLGFSF